MRRILVCLALLGSMALYGQDKLESSGKISMADMQMKSCDFDPDAKALCLIDFGEVYYNFSTVSVDIQGNYSVRIKI